MTDDGRSTSIGGNMTSSETYEERHARAADTFAVFVPDVDPERVSASMRRRIGADQEPVGRSLGACPASRSKIWLPALGR